MIEITENELSLDNAVRAVQQEMKGALGAVATFSGLVRDNSRGHQVQYLEYYVYPAMAQRQLEVIAEELKEKWHVVCAISHRVGHLNVGETSIIIAIASPHRAAAFEACRYALEQIKARVPIWKKEVTPDGFHWVEDPLQNARTDAEDFPEKRENPTLK